MKTKLKSIVAIILIIAMTISATACVSEVTVASPVPTNMPTASPSPIESVDDNKLESRVNAFDFELINVDGTYSTKPITGAENPHYIVLKWNKDKMGNHSFNDINNYIEVSVDYTGDGNSSVIEKKYKSSSKNQGDITFEKVYQDKDGNYTSSYQTGEVYLGLPLYTSGDYTVNLSINVLDDGFDYANAESTLVEYDTIDLSATGSIEKAIVNLTTFNNVYVQDPTLDGLNALDIGENVVLKSDEIFITAGVPLSQAAVLNILTPVGYSSGEIYISYTYNYPLQLNEIGTSAMNISFREKSKSSSPNIKNEIIPETDLVWANYQYHLLPANAYVISSYDYREVMDVATSIAEIPYSDPDASAGTTDSETIANLISKQVEEILIIDGFTADNAQSNSATIGDLFKNLIDSTLTPDKEEELIVAALTSMNVTTFRHDTVIKQIQNAMMNIEKIPTGSFDKGFESQATLAFMRYSQLSQAQQAWFSKGNNKTATADNFATSNQSNIQQWAKDYSGLIAIDPENPSSLLTFLIMANSQVMTKNQIATLTIQFESLELPTAEKFDVTNEYHINLTKKAIEFYESLNEADQNSFLRTANATDYNNAETQLLNIEVQKVMAEISALDNMYRTLAPKYTTTGNIISNDTTAINTNKLYFYDTSPTYGGVKVYIDSTELHNQAKIVLDSFNKLSAEGQKQIKNLALVNTADVGASPYHPTTLLDGGNGTEITYYGALTGIYNMNAVVENLKKVTDHVDISSYYHKEVNEPKAYSKDSSLVFDNLNLLIYGYQPLTKSPLNILNYNNLSLAVSAQTITTDFFGKTSDTVGFTQHFATSDIAYATIYAPKYVDAVIAEYIAWIDVLVALEEYKDSQILLLSDMIKTEFASKDYSDSDYSVATDKKNGAFDIIVGAIMNEINIEKNTYSQGAQQPGFIYNAPQTLRNAGPFKIVNTTFLEILDYEKKITPEEAQSEFDSIYDISEALEWYIEAYHSTNLSWGK